MVFKGNADADIWWRSTADGSTWTRPQAIPRHGTAAGPALAVFNDRLYCVTRGDKDADLWWTAFNGTSWSADTRLPNHTSAAGPALAARAVSHPGGTGPDAPFDVTFVLLLPGRTS
ncbi:hypothetical protein EDD29_4009 [Actinocorallia herbida]|uniref:BNR repeat protein n=1 Tax=Actinocorallia herbida TaxID=58109 RepID=A0A3N1CYT3_9ACTN|nr:hypothetical protein [Actinocorallia herbida]ROO86439.1 hypothetical protein EDD29_4009 [Actinocorallia herbida]